MSEAKYQVVVLTEGSNVVNPSLLRRAHAIHRQLRPHLSADVDQYVEKIQRVVKGGADMCVAIKQSSQAATASVEQAYSSTQAQGSESDSGEVLGLAVYRCFENTFNGRRFYVDDLVTSQTERSKGVGHTLMQFLREEAKRREANAFTLVRV